MLSEVMFCRVRVCPVWYEISYRIYTIIGMEVLQKLNKLRHTVLVLRRNLYPRPGIFTRAHPCLECKQKFRMCITKTIGYRYKRLTELTEPSGAGMKTLQNSQNCRVWINYTGKYISRTCEEKSYLVKHKRRRLCGNYTHISCLYLG